MDQVPGKPPMNAQRRQANIRTGLLLAGLAAAFFIFVVLKHSVLGA